MFGPITLSRTESQKVRKIMKIDNFPESARCAGIINIVPVAETCSWILEKNCCIVQTSK